MKRKNKVMIGLTAFLFMSLLSLRAETVSAGPEEKAIEDVAKRVFPSVVKVEARNGIRKVATGVIIDKDGYVVTTALISPRDEEITVITSDGKKSEAKFLGLDSETHIALLQVKERNLPAITLGSASALVPGSWVALVSYSPEDTPAVAQGIVSSVADDKLRLNIWVTRGASGSPVVNKEGQMVGLLRGVYAEDQPIVFEFREKETVGSGYVFSSAEAPSSGMALAVPIDMVKSITAEIREKGRVGRGWMGVSIYEREDGKVEIGEVEAQSPAELAKLKEGDVIQKIDGKEVTNGPMLASEIRKRKPGQDVKLEVLREGKILEVKVKLGEYSEDEAKKELELRFPRLFPRLEPSVPPRIVPEKTPRQPRLPEARKDIWKLEKRKYIGIFLDEINRNLSEYFGLKEGRGLLINSFSEDSPAKKAGLKIGDVIFKVDGKRVESVSELSELIQDKRKGDKIKVEFIRDKKPMSLDVEVGEEESQSFFYSPNWESYRDALGDYEQEMRRQMKEWQEKYGQQVQESLKKINKELKKTAEGLVEKRKEKPLKKIAESRWSYYRI